MKNIDVSTYETPGFRVRKIEGDLRRALRQKSSVTLIHDGLWSSSMTLMADIISRTNIEGETTYCVLPTLRLALRAMEEYLAYTGRKGDVGSNPELDTTVRSPRLRFVSSREYLRLLKVIHGGNVIFPCAVAPSDYQTLVWGILKKRLEAGHDYRIVVASPVLNLEGMRNYWGKWVEEVLSMNDPIEKSLIDYEVVNINKSESIAGGLTSAVLRALKNGSKGIRVFTENLVLTTAVVTEVNSVLSRWTWSTTGRTVPRCVSMDDPLVNAPNSKSVEVVVGHGSDFILDPKYNPSVDTVITTDCHYESTTLGGSIFTTQRECKPANLLTLQQCQYHKNPVKKKFIIIHKDGAVNTPYMPNIMRDSQLNNGFEIMALFGYRFDELDLYIESDGTDTTTETPIQRVLTETQESLDFFKLNDADTCRALYKKYHESWNKRIMPSVEGIITLQNTPRYLLKYLIPIVALLDLGRIRSATSASKVIPASEYSDIFRWLSDLRTLAVDPGRSFRTPIGSRVMAYKQRLETLVRAHPEADPIAYVTSSDDENLHEILGLIGVYQSQRLLYRTATRWRSVQTGIHAVAATRSTIDPPTQLGSIIAGCIYVTYKADGTVIRIADNLTVLPASVHEYIIEHHPSPESVAHSLGYALNKK